ncbi:endonuclease/exonuclease/phosphatase family protein [Actinoplanes rectilineatus]|uniref:endonuclease/exonuclease/phosphatase family protein n=1 Tax=Actinoplanes rectilineatus TaxID=113571 RepID=UPI0006964C6D|nr:endonuclease/exonuclease/phosphatase family protein [Actinoplanes rectilineatus]
MPLTLASINLHCGLDRHGYAYPVEEAIAALDTDVVLVQENWRPRGGVSLARAAAGDCGYPGYAELPMTGDVDLPGLAVAPRAPDEIGAWGIAVLSRHPITVRTPIGLGAAPGDVIGDRSAQVVEVAGLQVVNVHLTHRLPYGPAQLLRLRRGLAGDYRPTVIAGDFNMFWPTILLARPYRQAARGRTWPAHRPLAQIDHILRSPGLRIRRSGAMRGVGSDHRPIRVEVEVPRRAPGRHPDIAALRPPARHRP